MPRLVRRHVFAPVRDNRVVRAVLHVVLHPVLAPILFVAGVGFWLIPAMHFDVMLSLPLYKMLNWSMLLDGLPFRWLILERPPSPPAEMGFGGTLSPLLREMSRPYRIGAVVGIERPHR